MGDIALRLATAMDAEAAILVMRRSITELCARDHGNDPARLAGWLANKTPAHFMAWLADPLNTLIVAVRGQEVVGVGGVRAGLGITVNYVHPDARFCGVSDAMIARLEAMLVAGGAPMAYLVSTETALGFYQARGYRVRTSAETEQPVYGVALEKPL